MSETQSLLQGLAGHSAAVNWFGGLFQTAHVEVRDTHERFTVTHAGSAVNVQAGFHGATPSFVVPLEIQNLRNLSGFFADDRIDPYEEYRIVKFMLRPCLEAALSLPVLKNPAFQRIVRLETHWQEALLDPEGNEDEQLTVVYVNNQWLILPGYHGRPQRRLVMTPAQVLAYQRKVFAASEKNTLAAWLDAARWYLQWREEVSAPV
jgi:hypothetical protein